MNLTAGALNKDAHLPDSLARLLARNNNSRSQI